MHARAGNSKTINHREYSGHGENHRGYSVYLSALCVNGFAV